MASGCAGPSYTASSRPATEVADELAALAVELGTFADTLDRGAELAWSSSAAAPTHGSGAQVGATIGAVAGYALADGNDRWLGGLLGGALGGAAGRAADKGARKKKGWRLIIQLEETGEEIGVPVIGKKQKLKAGDRVRPLTGAGGATQVDVVKG